MRHIIFRAVFVIVQLFIGGNLLAQTKNADNASTDTGEVIITQHPLNKAAIFDADTPVVYNLDLKNTYNTPQKGTITYQITTLYNKEIAKKAYPVALDAAETKQVRIEMPSQPTGFYKVNFMINVNDYDDTVRRVFGVDIYKVHSPHPKPLDFDLFWKNAKLELAKIAPNYKVTEMPELEHGNDQIYLIEMKSVENITIRGWLTLPKDRLPTEKLPIYIVFPGYGADLKPIPVVKHFACMSLNVRGLGNSRDVINPDRESFITYNIQNRYKYIYRGAILDCIRMIDFASSRDDFDKTSIYVTGGSMGGFLTLAVASLDDRVTICAADNPSFSDFRSLLQSDHFPMASIQRFAKEHALNMNKILDNLDYFDLRNFVPNLKCKLIVGMGLLDPFVPPYNMMTMYNNIASTNKQLFIYPDLGHEVERSLGNIKGKWVYTNFHMYKRVLALRKEGGADNEGAKENNLADEDGSVTNEKFNTNPVGIEATAGAKNSLFKKDGTIYYDIDLKNNSGTAQKGTVTCEVTTKKGEHLSVTTVAVNLAAQASDQVHMNLPLQKGGYFKAIFILNVAGFKDTLRRSFGIDSEGSGANGAETIGFVDHPGQKESRFGGKKPVFYDVDLKNNFNIQQDVTLACEVKNKADKFVSYTSLAVTLQAGAKKTVRVNMPTPKRGQYIANFIIKTPQFNDTLHRSFSVDTAVTAGATTHTDEDETISMVEHPANKDGVFKTNTPVYYNLDLKNNFGTQQEGKITAQIATMNGDVISVTSFALSLRSKEKKQMRVNLPAQKTGFYRVNFCVNTNDYDDTVRRVYGVDIENIRSPHLKPEGFDDFWATAKAELAAIEPRFKMIERPDLSRGNDQVYVIEMQSIGNLTVRGWLTLPKDRKNKEKFPVYLALPGYGANMKPFHNMPDFAAIALNVRGLGNSNDMLNISREEFLTYNILDKNKYILRGAIMDCVRMVDFIFSRPEFDTKAVYSNGGSMGGYLSLILASLDHRIAVCTAGNPAFSDWRTLVDHNDFPMGSVQRYASENEVKLDKLLDNLDYFDLKNFVSAIKCKTLVGIGLLDVLAPPHTEMPAYNNIQANKKLFIFPNLGHQVGEEFGNFTGKLVFDEFGLF
ncbi:acetylxylan esterase [Mucilaginibacter gracilis]|nr:alpha/beta fold hydrolase [Mucilaginibacter gracilis]